METIIGIDLGTTNSEVSALVGNKVEILGPGDGAMLPSCVGLTPEDELLIGAPARNQQLLYPERTVRSIKRQMGSDEEVELGESSFSPQEISALILRELVGWATGELGERPAKAVITVPAYFSDAQRQATREAGELAGLEVVRLLNEPTAAALAFGHGEQRETVMVYDLGGGTFDVSIVTFEGDVTEVLASHGNNSLGGDDFTELLVGHLLTSIREEHKVDLAKEHPAAYSRLWWTAEDTKKKLSATPYVRVREENLAMIGGKPLHLDTEVSRETYEELIRPLIGSTMDSVSQALEAAKLGRSDIDAILLVGGSTRTPLVRNLLVQRTGLTPRQDVHPDLCVALGAGVMASRLAGHEVDQVLVDITPYSFGISYLGEREGLPYPYCYKPIIQRNTALPVTRTERYVTSRPHQPEANIEIYQGDDPDAMRNIMIGRFIIGGLTLKEGPNEILCQMKLDLNGILNVSAIEKDTGLSKDITITDALKKKSESEIAEARQRLETMFAARPEGPSAQHQPSVAAGDDAGPRRHDVEVVRDAEPEAAEARLDAAWNESAEAARALIDRANSLVDTMHADDQEEALELIERIRQALESKSSDALTEATNELRELLYFIEGE